MINRTTYALSDAASSTRNVPTQTVHRVAVAQEASNQAAVLRRPPKVLTAAWLGLGLVLGLGLGLGSV